MSLSIIIPANNEGAWIDACLAAVLASDGPRDAQVVVVARGEQEQGGGHADQQGIHPLRIPGRAQQIQRVRPVPDCI